jgi:hypothetical protein
LLRAELGCAFGDKFTFGVLCGDLGAMVAALGSLRLAGEDDGATMTVLTGALTGGEEPGGEVKNVLYF